MSRASAWQMKSVPGPLDPAFGKGRRAEHLYQRPVR
jgi:hypothetical protein